LVWNQLLWSLDTKNTNTEDTEKHARPPQNPKFVQRHVRVSVRWT